VRWPGNWHGCRNVVIDSSHATTDVAGELARLSEADIAVVLRYETDGTATVLGGWRGAGMPAVTGRRLAVDGEGVAESVLRTGWPARDTRFAGAPGSMTDWLRRAGMRAATGSPVVAGGRLWGADHRHHAARAA
jgi:hypothetical protein